MAPPTSSGAWRDQRGGGEPSPAPYLGCSRQELVRGPLHRGIVGLTFDPLKEEPDAATSDAVQRPLAWLPGSAGSQGDAGLFRDFPVSGPGSRKDGVTDLRQGV